MHHKKGIRNQYEKIWIRNYDIVEGSWKLRDRLNYVEKIPDATSVHATPEQQHIHTLPTNLVSTTWCQA